jgi:hypothetical protein
MLLDNSEPTNYEEAMMGLDFDKWLEAMKSEKGSMFDRLHHRGVVVRDEDADRARRCGLGWRRQGVPRSSEDDRVPLGIAEPLDRAVTLQ